MSVPNNRVLYDSIKSELKRKNKGNWSAYLSGQLVQEYKRRGGTYSGSRNPTQGLDRWFREHWEGRSGVYRPTKRITKDTPLTFKEIDPKNLKEQIKRKATLSKGTNLKPFKKK